MNSVLDKYFSRRKNELVFYANILIHMFSCTGSDLIEGKSKLIKKVLGIYFDNYYMAERVDFSLLEKYFKLNEETDPNFMAFLQSTIEYYSNENLSIVENNKTVIYLSYITYFAHLINKFRDTIIMMPKKDDFLISIANKVTKSFVYNVDDKFKENIDKLSSIIKSYIKEDAKIKSLILDAKNNDSFVTYQCWNDEHCLYQIKYNTIIPDLDTYKEKDVRKIYNEKFMDNNFKIMSYELALITLLKCLYNDQRLNVVLEIDSNFYKKKSSVTSLLKLLSNQYAIDYTRLLIKSSDYVENDNFKRLKDIGVRLLIDTNRFEEIKDLEFTDNMSVLINHDFYVKFKQDMDDKGIKYIQKTIDKEYNENDLFFTKLDFTEVTNE